MKQLHGTLSQDVAFEGKEKFVLEPKTFHAESSGSFSF